MMMWASASKSLCLEHRGRERVEQLSREANGDQSSTSYVQEFSLHPKHSRKVCKQPKAESSLCL